MMAKAWIVRLFDPEFIGVIYFDTRREARRFHSLLSNPSMQESGLKGRISRTGLR